MMHAMWARLPLKVVSALWAGSRNSYTLSTQERELREMTLWESRRCKVFDHAKEEHVIMIVQIVQGVGDGAQVGGGEG